MFKEFFAFELKYWLKNPMVYIFLLLNFAMVLGACLSSNITVGSDMGNVNINSPFALMSYAAIVSLISIVMTTTFVNQSALKDFTSNFHSILFATPMKRVSYLLGRFTSSILVSCIPLFGILLAVFVAPFLYQDEGMVGPVYFKSFVDTFTTFLLPNTILIGSIIFALAVKFRSTTISFIGAIFLLMGYLLASSFLDNINLGETALLVDPFGVSSISEITKYWTLSEKNSQWLNLSGPMLLNRVIWMSVAAMIFLASYFSFSFAQKRSAKTKNKEMKSPDMGSQFKVLEKLPRVTKIHNNKTQWAQLFAQYKSDFFGIVKSPAFLIILIFAFVNLLGGIIGSDSRHGGGNFPVTYYILQGVTGSLHLFIFVIIGYYTSALIWRERQFKFSEIIDASPFSSWVSMVSKYLSMLSVVFLILLVAMFFGMGVQALKGYYNFEPLLYIKQLFLIDLSYFAIMVAVSLFIHVLIDNRYAGIFVFILFLVANKFLWGGLEIESNLLKVAGTPSFTYSDFHKFSLGESGLKWYNFYWLLFAGIIFIASILFSVRGKALKFKDRLRIAKHRFSSQMAVPFYGVFSLWFAVGGYLFYNANVLNNSITSAEETERKISYEKKYKQYEGIAQPRIVALDHSIEIFPNRRKMVNKTEMVLKNKHKHAIDSIHFSTAKIFKTQIDLPGSTMVYSDDICNYFIYKLDKGLMPGDSLNLTIHTSYEAIGIENEVSMEWINENGTFVHANSFMPVIGYDDSNETEESSKRKEFGLKPLERTAKLEHKCSSTCSNSYISSDSDWIRLSSTISTSADQIAIAPGALVNEWTENGRNYYRYELDKPVINFYSFLSARYEVQRETWEGVDLEVYYHKGHEYNVEKMMRSMRESLIYFSENFSPYPHKQARIIEFPRFSSFAQAFPGTMPYSESMGFIANLKDTDEVDVVFQTVAHEMAHQWWAHQVIGSDMQGATMLSETFAQYSSMMVLEKEYGKKLSQKFLKHQLDAYLRYRGGESIAELPLMKVENQDYIHYNKGTVVMNAVREYIGEDSLNYAMKRFIDQTAYQEPPYTNSNVFMEELEQIIPDTFQYLIDDMFKDIVLYNNGILSGEYQELSDGKYELKLNIEVEKFRADKKGMEQELPVDDYIYVGVYGETNSTDDVANELHYELHKFDQKNKTIHLILDEKPVTAGIDPNYLLIDRLRADNLMELVVEQ